MIEYCSLSSGSRGNCHYLKIQGRSFLVDVGMSAKYIKESLVKIGSHIDEIEGVFITHEHSDHISGLKILAKHHDFFLYLHQLTYDYLSELLCDVPLERIIFVEEQKPIHVGEIAIKPFEVSHDAIMTLGYNFYYEDKQLSIATDVGAITEDLVEELSQADFLVLESNHDENLVEVGPYPYLLKQRILGDQGHLSNRSAAELIVRLLNDYGKLRFVVLAHLSENNNYPELAYMHATNVLEKAGYLLGEDIVLCVARRKQITEVYQMM